MKKKLVQAAERTLTGRAALIHRRKLGHLPNLLRPTTFNEKVLYKCIHDRRAFLVKTADKVAVRDYVADTIGPHYLTDLLAATTDADELDFTQMPDAFVLKANHGSGPNWHRIVTDRSQEDPEKLRMAAQGWMSQRYRPDEYEAWYWRIPPKIMVEGFLGDPAVGTPDDYRFYVFNGQVAMVQVERGRLDDHRRGFFTPDWELLDLEAQFPPLGYIEPPAVLGEMLSVSAKLAAPTDFVRVDLYQVDGQIKFGEMTHSPHAGRMKFSDPSFNRWLGSLWNQPRRYR